MPVLKFLLLEDSLLDIELIGTNLSDGGIECELTPVRTESEFQTALEQSNFDLILADYSLPEFDGISALAIAQSLHPDVPFIFVTATMGEEIAIETLKAGATDYVLKQRLGRLVPSIERALHEKRERRARQEAETKLYNREQEIRALVENSPDIIARVDREFRHIYINPIITSLTGFSQESFIGKTAKEIGFPQDFYEPWSDVINICFVTGKKCSYEFDFATPKGLRSYESRLEPEFAQDGKTVQSILIVSRDITLSKQAQIQLQQQTAQLERANRIKDEFLAVLSHELRSPLHSILGWSNLLRNQKLDPVTFQRGLETIERNAKLQTQLVEDLLDVSRIIRGKVTLNSEPTNLISIIEAAIDSLRLAAQAKNIDFKLSILDFGLSEKSQIPNPKSPIPNPKSPNPKFQVLGDASRLQQIFWNLLSNAIKFTSESGQVEVELSRVDSTYAQISVKDTGIGIKKEFLPYVFESFRQEDSSTTRQYGGLGLGLAIVRHLVSMHGATITAESAGEGLGATFTVRIPLLNTNNPEEVNLPPHSPLPTPHSPLKGIRILGLDDDADSREFLAFALENYGAIVNVVASASTALQVLPSFRPDLIVSDIGMPNQDGYSFIRQLRNLPQEQGGQTPAIALTGYASDLDRHRAITAGYQKHLSKPVNLEELVEAIALLVNNQ